MLRTTGRKRSLRLEFRKKTYHYNFGLCYMFVYMLGAPFSLRKIGLMNGTKFESHISTGTVSMGMSVLLELPRFASAGSWMDLHAFDDLGVGRRRERKEMFMAMNRMKMVIVKMTMMVRWKSTAKGTLLSTVTVQVSDQLTLVVSLTATSALQSRNPTSSIGLNLPSQWRRLIGFGKTFLCGALCWERLYHPRAHCYLRVNHRSCSTWRTRKMRRGVGVSPSFVHDGQIPFPTGKHEVFRRTHFPATCATRGVWRVVVLLLPSSLVFNFATIISGDPYEMGLYGVIACGLESFIRGLVSYVRTRVDSAEASTRTGHGDESLLVPSVPEDPPVGDNSEAVQPGPQSESSSGQDEIVMNGLKGINTHTLRVQLQDSRESKAVLVSSDEEEPVPKKVKPRPHQSLLQIELTPNCARPPPSLNRKLDYGIKSGSPRDIFYGRIFAIWPGAPSFLRMLWPLPQTSGLLAPRFASIGSWTTMHMMIWRTVIAMIRRKRTVKATSLLDRVSSGEIYTVDALDASTIVFPGLPPALQFSPAVHPRLVLADPGGPSEASSPSPAAAAALTSFDVSLLTASLTLQSGNATSTTGLRLPSQRPEAPTSSGVRADVHCVSNTRSGSYEGPSLNAMLREMESATCNGVSISKGRWTRTTTTLPSTATASHALPDSGGPFAFTEASSPSPAAAAALTSFDVFLLSASVTLKSGKGLNCLLSDQTATSSGFRQTFLCGALWWE
ncbi:hypothetical protein CPB85DRAFT_1254376 [Mucidula mucida]|nr:hypothetical protein CPB85DRAFT_1254376 [Mucidula mucida]